MTHKSLVTKELREICDNGLTQDEAQRVVHQALVKGKNFHPETIIQQSLVRAFHLAADDAFDQAIDTGRLSADPDADNYAGDYKYMGLGPTGARFKKIRMFCWIITRDHLDNKDMSVSGPSGVSDSEVESAKNGTPFRMYDDDGILNLSGRATQNGGEELFAPLNDYGLPSYGCTEIRFFLNGRWKTI